MCLTLSGQLKNRRYPLPFFAASKKIPIVTKIQSFESNVVTGGIGSSRTALEAT